MRRGRRLGFGQPRGSVRQFDGAGFVEADSEKILVPLPRAEFSYGMTFPVCRRAPAGCARMPWDRDSRSPVAGVLRRVRAA